MSQQTTAYSESNMTKKKCKSGVFKITNVQAKRTQRRAERQLNMVKSFIKDKI